MKPSPRTRRKLLAPLLACAFIPFPAPSSSPRAAAQNARTDAKQPAQKRTDAKAGEKAERDAKASAKATRARRETREAIAALKEAAELARAFEDVYESVRAQSEAADAVWPFDEPWARSVLRRAWDATNAPGAEGHVEGFGTSEDAREDALDALTTARHYVVKAALKHDARLGEAFMRELERAAAERASAGAEDATPEADDPAAPLRRRRTLSAAARQRLTVARQLSEDGDFRAAASAAAPVVAEGATPELLKFILDLRAHDAGDADALYLRLLAWARADPTADANDVLLLSTPVVSPELIVYLNADGSAGFEPLHYRGADARSAAASLPPRVRLAFFETAAAVLLRPRVTRAGAAQMAEASAVYFAAGRLLPSVDREAPQFAPALNARLAALASELEAPRREALSAKMDLSSLAPKNPSDPLAVTLQRASQATGAADRDLARVLVVSEAARLALWDRARAVTEEIEGAEARRAARLVVAIRQATSVRRAYEDEGAEGMERAAAFVKASDVPPEARALGLAQAAELAAVAGAASRADALLAEAAGLAAEADRGTQRASALALVTLSAARAGSARVWEMLPAFVRAADEADELRYGAMLLEFNVGPSDRKLWVTAPGESVGLGQLFAAAARLDPLKAFAEARGFADEELRAAALLASGRAALEKNAGAPAGRDAGAARPGAR